MGQEKGVRLKVNPDGGVFHEMLGTTKDAKGRPVGGRPVSLKPGTVFIHPDQERAKFLLALRPFVVLETGELTDEEKAHRVAVDQETAKAANAGLRLKAEEVVQKREEKLVSLETQLRKDKPENLRKEAEKRSLKVEGLAPEDILALVVADERAKLEAAS